MQLRNSNGIIGVGIIAEFYAGLTPRADKRAKLSQCIVILREQLSNLNSNCLNSLQSNVAVVTSSFDISPFARQKLLTGNTQFSNETRVTFSEIAEELQIH